MNDLPPFIPGLKLSELFYQDAVRPILAAHFPELRYSAARLDYGSDVLGFDTPQSRDHGWGPKLQLFLAKADAERYAGEIERRLSEELPYEIAGYSTHFAGPEGGNEQLQTISAGPVRHGVSIWTIRSFFAGYLDVDPSKEIPAVQWLLFPEQRLRTIAFGRVFEDGLGALEGIRARLRYYPRDVWLYMLAAQWRRIGQEEPFVGRTGDVGDELGSRVIAARLVRDVMRLCFLMEQVYAPYSKWFGTAFARLDCAPVLAPLLEGALQAASWKEREGYLSPAYEAVARMHNDLGITAPLPAEVRPFYSRPYQVIDGGRFTEAIRATITSEEVRRWPAYVGSVDQFVDSTDVLEYNEPRQRLLALYE